MLHRNGARFNYLIFVIFRQTKDIGTNISIASTVTISRFGPSGSLIRKNINLEIVKEIIRSIRRGTFFIIIIVSMPYCMITID